MFVSPVRSLFRGIPPVGGGGGALDWREDFRVSFTDKGLVLDGNNATINRITKASATGTWPSGITHVAENIYVAEQNTLYEANGLWLAPVVGDYLFERMLICNNLPDGANTGPDHGFQTNIGEIAWMWRIHGGDTDSFDLDFTTWDRLNIDHLTVDAPKDTVLRLESRVQRTSTSTASAVGRIYNNQTGTLLGESVAMAQSPADATIFDAYLFGMAGIGGASFNGGSVYWGALARRISASNSDWIGAYPVIGVED